MAEVFIRHHGSGVECQGEDEPVLALQAGLAPHCRLEPTGFLQALCEGR